VAAPDARHWPKSQFAARSPPPAAWIRYNVRLLRFPAPCPLARGPLRPPRRLKAW